MEDEVALARQRRRSEVRRVEVQELLLGDDLRLEVVHAVPGDEEEGVGVVRRYPAKATK